MSKGHRDQLEKATTVQILDNLTSTILLIIALNYNTQPYSK